MCGKDERNKVTMRFISSDAVQLEQSLTWEQVASFLFLTINPGEINNPFTREISLLDHVAFRWVFVVIYTSVI